MKYYVTVNAEDHEVELDGATATVGGQASTAHLTDVDGTPMRLVSVDGRVYRVVVRRGDHRGAYTLSLDGHRFAVEALDERAHVIRSLSGAAAAAAGPAPLVAPMPGLVVRVNVAVGDRVSAGQGLVVMEAMKMENELRATSDATVKAVLARQGEAVEKGAILLEME